MRSQSASSLALGYTGQLTDPTTGFIDLRARQLDPTLGRFLSADTVQPNAPGTQGYNLYAYTANNPTTWTDLERELGQRRRRAGFLSLATACRLDLWCAGPLIDGLRRVASGEWLVQAGGFVESVLAVVACALTSSCLRLSQDIGLIVSTYGGGVDSGGGNRPPSPATCIRDAVNGLAHQRSARRHPRLCRGDSDIIDQREIASIPIKGGSGAVIPQKAYDVYDYVRAHSWSRNAGIRWKQCVSKHVELNSLRLQPELTTNTILIHVLLRAGNRWAQCGTHRREYQDWRSYGTTSNHYGKVR